MYSGELGGMIAAYADDSHVHSLLKVLASEVSTPLIGDLGAFSSRLVLLIINLNFITPS